MDKSINIESSSTSNDYRIGMLRNSLPTVDSESIIGVYASNSEKRTTLRTSGGKVEAIIYSWNNGNALFELAEEMQI